MKNKELFVKEKTNIENCQKIYSFDGNFIIEADYKIFRTKNYQEDQMMTLPVKYKVLCLNYCIIDNFLIEYRWDNKHDVYEIELNDQKKQKYLGTMFIDTANRFSFTSQSLGRSMPEHFGYNLLLALKFLQKYSLFQPPYHIPGYYNKPKTNLVSRQERFLEYHQDFFDFNKSCNSFDKLKNKYLSGVKCVKLDRKWNKVNIK